MLKLCLPIVLALSALSPFPGIAHEFWIEPQQYQVETGGEIIARFRNGENFKGVSLGFFDRRSVRMQVADAEGLHDLSPRAGDNPAIRIDRATGGLTILLHETVPSTITYKDWQKFVDFTAQKDLADALRQHDERGLPREWFKEHYTRHAKALVAAGDGAGADKAFGLETEFVLLSNPYQGNSIQNMKVFLLYDNAPRIDAQVEVYERSPDGTVAISKIKTDAQGKASFTTKPGHEYLLDAVVLRPAPEGSEAVWETVWASLTFAVPQ